MTENETKTIDDCLKELRGHRSEYLKRSTPWRIINRAVRLIIELKEYKEIGTIDEFKALKYAEKQGLILKLPVAEGTNVFCIGSCGELCDDFDTDCEVCGEHEVVFCVNFDRNMVEQFGKTVFITEEEAEKELAKRKSK